MTFEIPITARFHEVDRAGIIFFGRVFEYAHTCYEELLIAAFGGFDRLFDERGFGTPIVHSEADFRRPIRQSDRLIVRARVEGLSSRSITFCYEIIGDGGADDLRCTVQMKHAFVSLDNFRAIECPAFFTTGLKGIGLLDAPLLEQ